jgi:hypothetical protein
MKNKHQVLLHKTVWKILVFHQIRSISYFTPLGSALKVDSDHTLLATFPSSQHTYSHTHTQKQGHATHSYTTENSPKVSLVRKTWFLSTDFITMKIL